MRQVSLLLFISFPSCFPINPRGHNLHFLRIVDSDFDACVCLDGMVCRAALFPPYTRLVVDDILVLLLRNLGVVEILQQLLMRDSISENILFEIPFLRISYSFSFVRQVPCTS